MSKSESRFQDLVDSFPTLRRAPGASPWDAMKLLGWLCNTGLSHGELLAARFVLGVWNAHTDWVEEARKAGFSAPAVAKRFDLIEAVGVWDRVHLDAVQAWLEEPFFP